MSAVYDDLNITHLVLTNSGTQTGAKLNERLESSIQVFDDLGSSVSANVSYVDNKIMVVAINGNDNN